MTDTPRPSRGAPVTATATGPSIGWRLGMSAWLLLLLVGGGGLAWLAFGGLAAIARRRSWAIFAGIYAVAAIAAQVPEDPAGRIVQGTLYLIVLVHGLIINQSWLLLLWGRLENGLTILGTVRGARTAPAGRRRRQAAIPKEAQTLLGGAGTARSDYVDESAPAAPAPRRRRTARAPARTIAEPALPAELIDVNTANQRTLAKLTGLDRALAKAAITERTRRGGFSTLEDFAATAGLQPHEIVRLRDEAFCSARPRAKRSFGRRVDY